jgi:hypothetical protein
MNSSSVNLVKFAKLPRLYRILRISKIIKVLKIVNEGENFFNKNLNMNSGISKLLHLAVLWLLFLHIGSCIFYYIAKINNFSENTWVSHVNALGYDNVDTLKLYILSIYYCLTIVTTIG